MYHQYFSVQIVDRNIYLIKMFENKTLLQHSVGHGGSAAQIMVTFGYLKVKKTTKRAK